MAVVGTNVTAANYNTIQQKIQDVLGLGDGGQNGYGRDLQSSQKSSGDLIQASDMQALYDDLIKARLHQANPLTWTNADGLAAPSAAENVGVSAADVGDETPIDITALTNGIEYQILSIDPDPNNPSDFTLIGASANEVGIKFVATGPGTGSGQAKLAPTSENAEEDLSEGYLDFEAAASEIVTDINVHDVTNFSTTTKATSERTSQWGGGDYASPGSKITHEIEITWANADERRYFFNSGGEIRFNADLIGAVTANSKNDVWNTILENMGTIHFTKNSTYSDGSNPGTGTQIGNYYASWGSTSSSNRATIFTKNGSGLYADIKYTIEAWEVGAGNNTTPSVLRFRIEFQDNDFSTGSPYPSIDEYVTNNITSNALVYHDTVLGIPAPSFTEITELDGGVQGGAVASLTRTPATGTINEGDSVTFTLSVNPSANGTTVPYQLSGVGIDVSDFDNSQGMGGDFVLNGGQDSVTITMAEDLTTDTGGDETLTCYVPSFNIQTSIQVIDTSQSVTAPPPANTYQISGPGSLDEGTQGTYNFTTNDTDGTYYYTVAPTGVMDSDSGSFQVTGGNGSFSLTALSDATIGDTEDITVSARTGGIGGTVVDQKVTTINDTTPPPVTENFYSLEYYTVSDLDQGTSGTDNFETWGDSHSKTTIVSANSSNPPTVTTLSRNRFYAGTDTGYTWTKGPNDNRIDVWLIGGGGGGGNSSVDSAREGTGPGGGSGATSFRTYTGGNIPTSTNIIVGCGGDGGELVSGSNDMRGGGLGGTTSFSSTQKEYYSFQFGNQSFVFQGTNQNSVWVHQGKVLATGLNDFTSSKTINGVVYNRGSSKAQVSTGTPTEPEIAFYYAIETASDSFYTTGGTGGLAQAPGEFGSGGGAGIASGGSINNNGVQAQNCTAVFNGHTASTGAAVNFGNGVLPNIPNGTNRPLAGVSHSSANTFENGGRANPPTGDDMINWFVYQGGASSVHQTANIYPNGLGPGCGGGGRAMQQLAAYGGAGHPGLVAVKRYSSTGPARQFQTYTANGTSQQNFISTSAQNVTITGISQNFTISTGSHSLATTSIVRTIVTNVTNMPGYRYQIVVVLTGNVPAERIHSVTLTANGSGNQLNFVRTVRTQRSYNSGTNQTSFVFDTLLDGTSPLIQPGDGAGPAGPGLIWNTTWNLLVRTLE